MNEASRNSIDPLRQLAGNIVITVGVLWMLLCGSCSAFFLFQMFGSGLHGATGDQITQGLAIVLIPGGIGIAIGLGIYAVGRAIAGRRKG